MRPGHCHRHAHGHQVVQHPVLVALFFVHVFVQEVTYGLQGVVARRAHAAGGGGAHRVELPDHVVQLQQQRAVALHTHALGHGIDHHRVRLEGAAVLVGAGHQFNKNREHAVPQEFGVGVA